MNNVSEQTIAQMFSDYVCRMQDKERHTEAACKEVDSFDSFCAENFPNNTKLQVRLYDKMMDVAVEFEESGFIAGFQMAMKLLSDFSVEVVA